MCVPDSLPAEVGVAVATDELAEMEVIVEADVVEVTTTCNGLQIELSPTLTTRCEPTTKTEKKMHGIL